MGCGLLFSTSCASGRKSQLKAAVEEITEETATVEAAAQEIAEETATAEAVIEEIAEAAVTGEDETEEIDVSAMRIVNVLANGEAGANLYAATDETAEPIAEVSNGTALYMAEYDSVWAKVVYDNSYAYIRTADLVIYNAEDVSEEEKAIFRTVSIHNELDGMPIVVIGMDISLTAELTGFENTEYSVQWYYSLDGTERVEIPGATSLTYTYKVNAQNVHYYWFVTVTVPDDIAAAE